MPLRPRRPRLGGVRGASPPRGGERRQLVGAQARPPGSDGDHVPCFPVFPRDFLWGTQPPPHRAQLAPADPGASGPSPEAGARPGVPLPFSAAGAKSFSEPTDAWRREEGQSERVDGPEPGPGARIRSGRVPEPAAPTWEGGHAQARCQHAAAQDTRPCSAARGLGVPCQVGLVVGDGAEPTVPPTRSQDGRTRPATPQTSLHQACHRPGAQGSVDDWVWAKRNVPPSPSPPGEAATRGGSGSDVALDVWREPPIDLYPWLLDFKHLPGDVGRAPYHYPLKAYSRSVRVPSTLTVTTSHTLVTHAPSPSPPSAGVCRSPPWTFGCTRQPGAAVGGLSEGPKVHPTRTSPKLEPGRKRKQMQF